MERRFEMGEKNDKEQFHLDLFSFFGNTPAKNNREFNPKIIHSNTISIYDALPKYSWADRQPKESKIVRSCTLERIDYEMTIRPAFVERINSKTKEKNQLAIYPGEREEAIEDVLRGLAANGQGETFGDEMGVYFTIKQVRDELENIGKTFSHTEIVEALMVCNRASLQVRVKGKIVVNSALFPNVTLTDRENYEADSSTKCFVRFHPMVMASVINLDYRMFNYSLAMTIRSPLARHIYKRMTHYWRQASRTHKYSFNLMTYLTQTPRNISPRMGRNIDAMNRALTELENKGILENYTVKEIYEGRKLLDAAYSCTPHVDFIADIKKANYVSARRNLYSSLPSLPKQLK